MVSADVVLDSAAPREQFYETKLFRVVIARRALVDGQAVIVRKAPDPHFYSLTIDELEEFGYLIKKVSFWVMRLTHASAFTVLLHDGTAEVEEAAPLQVHVLPRHYGDNALNTVFTALHGTEQPLDDTSVGALVAELKKMLQFP